MPQSVFDTIKNSKWENWKKIEKSDPNYYNVQRISQALLNHHNASNAYNRLMNALANENRKSDIAKVEQGNHCVPQKNLDPQDATIAEVCRAVEHTMGKVKKRLEESSNLATVSSRTQAPYATSYKDNSDEAILSLKTIFITIDDHWTTPVYGQNGEILEPAEYPSITVLHNEDENFKSNYEKTIKGILREGIKMTEAEQTIKYYEQQLPDVFKREKNKFDLLGKDIKSVMNIKPKPKDEEEYEEEYEEIDEKLVKNQEMEQRALEIAKTQLISADHSPDIFREERGAKRDLKTIKKLSTSNMRGEDWDNKVEKDTTNYFKEWIENLDTQIETLKQNIDESDFISNIPDRARYVASTTKAVASYIPLLGRAAYVIPKTKKTRWQRLDILRKKREELDKFAKFNEEAKLDPKSRILDPCFYSDGRTYVNGFVRKVPDDF
jgi:hypothetical protein